MIGSALAHAAVLIASATSAAVPAEPAEPPRPRHSGGAFVLHPVPLHWSSAWPTPPALQACFSEAVLHPNEPVTEQTIEAFAYKADGLRSWARYAAPDGPGPEDKEVRAALFAEGLAECALVARNGGWSGRGRVFVRVTREAADKTLVQALPLDDDAKDEGLLCCLRESQEMVALGMKPGHTVRYTFQDGEGGIDLTPPPM